jgi:hypothetical protein
VNKSLTVGQSVKKITAVFFILTFFSVSSFAQKWEIGVGLGANMYRGELAPSFKPWDSRPGIEGLLRYNVSPTIALRLNMLYAGIHGTDKDNKFAMAKVRDAKFSNSIYELAFLAEYNFLDFRKDARYFETSGRFAPYLAFGLGFFGYNAYADTKNSTFNPCIPLGAGIKWAISKQANVGVEALYRFTFTDGLDDTYSKNNSTNTTGAQTAYTNDTDAYLFISAKFTWTFYKVVCAQDFQK